MTFTLSPTPHAGFIDQATALYESAFPADERRPTDEWLSMMDREAAFHILYITDTEHTFGGFITFWDFDEFTYIEHFAVKQELRGLGYGGKALDLFVTYEKNRRIVLEVEPPTNATAEKRIRFYQNHGFTLLLFPYMQPPYSPSLQSIPLKLMLKGTEPTNEETKSMVHVIKKRVYSS